MNRVPASRKTRKQLQELFDGEGAGSAGKSDLIRMAGRLIIEEALEAEMEDATRRKQVFGSKGPESVG